MEIKDSSFLNVLIQRSRSPGCNLEHYHRLFEALRDSRVAQRYDLLTWSHKLAALKILFPQFDQVKTLCGPLMNRYQSYSADARHRTEVQKRRVYLSIENLK